mmetsp:Transcript_49506/g.67361  ORF Transcript_49506/g.67361 Transcript_49506/m.67361 type:complete len:106 (-) Transcript_49506:351-668(-)
MHADETTWREQTCLCGAGVELIARIGCDGTTVGICSGPRLHERQSCGVVQLWAVPCRALGRASGPNGRLPPDIYESSSTRALRGSQFESGCRLGADVFVYQQLVP